MTSIYQVDKMELNVLGKRNSMRKNLKAHTEMHSFDNKEHLCVHDLGIGYMMMNTTSTSRVLRFQSRN